MRFGISFMGKEYIGLSIILSDSNGGCLQDSWTITELWSLTGTQYQPHTSKTGVFWLSIMSSTTKNTAYKTQKQGVIYKIS